jgi:hypothetical protein
MDSYFTNVPKDRGDEEEIDVDKTLTKNISISKRKLDGEKSSSTDGKSKKVVKKEDDQKESAQNSNQGSIIKKKVQQSIKFVVQKKEPKRMKKGNSSPSSKQVQRSLEKEARNAVVTTWLNLKASNEEYVKRLDNKLAKAAEADNLRNNIIVLARLS